MINLHFLYKAILLCLSLLVATYVQTQQSNPFDSTASEQKKRQSQGVFVGELLTQKQRWRVYQRSERYHIERDSIE